LLTTLISNAFIFSFCSSIRASERDSTTFRRHSIGFVSGYGAQRLGYIDIGVDYTYQVTFLQVQYACNVFRKKKWSIDILAQPQFNPVRDKRPDTAMETLNGLEFGVNIGDTFGYNVYKNILRLYTILSVGPHYIRVFLNVKRKDSSFQTIFSGFAQGWENIFISTLDPASDISAMPVWKDPTVVSIPSFSAEVS
jgi:hypothetical protein